MYGNKTEVSVAQIGQVVNVTDHNSGSISDVVIFQCELDSHNQTLNKYGKDKEIAKTTFVAMKFQENWAVLMDKVPNN